MFDPDMVSPERAISLTLQTLGSAGSRRALWNLFETWPGDHAFIANEIIALEYVSCFDGLNTLNLIDVEDMVDRLIDEELSGAVVPWLAGAHAAWFRANPVKRDELIRVLAAHEACDQLSTLVRASGVSGNVLAELAEWHSNDGQDLVDALAAAAEFVDEPRSPRSR